MASSQTTSIKGNPNLKLIERWITVGARKTILWSQSQCIQETTTHSRKSQAENSSSLL